MLILFYGEWGRVMMRGGGSIELRKEFGFWSNIDVDLYFNFFNY